MYWTWKITCSVLRVLARVSWTIFKQQFVIATFTFTKITLEGETGDTVHGVDSSPERAPKTETHELKWCRILCKNVGFPREFTVHTIRCSSDTGFRWTWLVRPAVALVREHQPQLSCRSRNQSTSVARVATLSVRVGCSLQTVQGRTLSQDKIKLTHFHGIKL